VNELPGKFKEKIRTLLGAESGSFFLALEEEPVTSVRKNPAKQTSCFDEEDRVAWCGEGRYLKQRPSFIADPLFHAGAYYVQESSSMFLNYVLGHILPQFNTPVKVLDLCAAPGGKSTLISSLLKPDDLLVSNEIIRSRVDILDENLMRWGQRNTCISNNDPKDFSTLTSFFDIILVDAPCSGEGMFRKDKNAIAEWSEEQVRLCAGRQQRILADVLPALKPGGFLIYSTCTFNEEENEENVAWMINEFGMSTTEIPFNEGWPVRHSAFHSFRFLPHLVKGEGLFIACLQKQSGIDHRQKFREQKLTFTGRKHEAELGRWLHDPDRFDFIEWNGRVHAIYKKHVLDIAVLARHLHLRNAGIQLGELVREKLLPSHYLALSVDLQASVRHIPVSLDEAQKYLRKDTLAWSRQYEQDIYLLRYESLGIGWVKVLPNRVNNYLPTHLRILKEL
jgi:16S rRNA C967 or C1407 C5-methylase (RsmB/RsmF family)/NOL1/NOP2/fmu family ribosome biogenesis protein